MSEDTTQKIGLIGILSLGLTTVIGSGVWGDPFNWVNQAGSFAILTVVISWLLFFTAGLAYAEVVGMFPNSGGPYSYVSGAINKKWGSVLGFLYYLGYIIIGPILVFVSVSSFLAMVGSSSQALLVILTVLIIVILAFVVELIPLKIVGYVVGGWIALKVLSLLIIFIIFIAKGDGANLSTPSFSGQDFVAVGNSSLWALMGFEVILVFSGDLLRKGDTKEEGKRLPRGILMVLAAILIIYILVIIGSGMIVAQGDIGENVEVFSYIETNYGVSASLLNGLKSFSALGTAFAIFIMLGHQLKVMTQGESLPKIFAEKKFRIPIYSSTFTAILSGISGLVMVLLLPSLGGRIIGIFSYVGLGLILLAAMIPAGIIALYLRVKMPILERPFKTPLYYVVFPLSIILGIYLFVLNLIALIGAL